jgi:WD40 repeat protein
LISNERLISGSSDSTIKIWNILSGECLKTLKGHSGPIWSIQLITNDRVISCSNDKTIKIWDLSTGQCVGTCIGHTKDVACIQLIDLI